MTECRGPFGYVASVLGVVQNEVPRFSDTIEQVIGVLYEAEWDGEDEGYNRRSDEVQNLVQAIIGPEGVHMRRWKSFKFSPLGDWEIISENTWNPFKYPTPNLEAFILDGGLWRSDYDLFEGTFPDLSAVRHLTFRDPYGLGSIPTIPSPPHLLTADIDLHQEEDKLDIISDCRTLQELTISRIYGPLTQSPTARKRELKLPTLRKLTLQGDVSALKHITFRTPCLESLKLLCGCKEAIPEVQARSVVWVALGRDPDLILEMVRRLVVGIKEMEELVIKCKEAEKLSLAIHGIITQADAAIVDILRVVRFEEGEE
ncbi:hypothetical protein FRC17_008118 [Serendipita sp. 399]|nr:hypothetical protein FRC17_008118 [Serendipita sp. 399]